MSKVKKSVKSHYLIMRNYQSSARLSGRLQKGRELFDWSKTRLSCSMKKIAHRMWDCSCVIEQNYFTLFFTDLAKTSLRTVADESFSGLLTVFSTCSSIETRLIFATTVGTLSASRRCWNCRIALRQQISWFDFLAWISRIRLSLIIRIHYKLVIYEPDLWYEWEF